MNDQRDSHQVHNATQTAVSVAVIAAIGFLIYVFFAIQTGAWQLYATSAVISGIFIASLLTVRLCRQNRIQAGIWLLLGTIALGASLASVLVADLGLMVGLIVLIILFQISAQTLSSTETRWASILGIAVAIFMSAAEAFSGSIQFVHPLVSPATLIITVVLVLVFGWSIARSYLTYP
jgi:hypothetical protein